MRFVTLHTESGQRQNVLRIIQIFAIYSSRCLDCGILCWIGWLSLDFGHLKMGGNRLMFNIQTRKCVIWDMHEGHIKCSFSSSPGVFFLFNLYFLFFSHCFVSLFQSLFVFHHRLYFAFSHSLLTHTHTYIVHAVCRKLLISLATLVICNAPHCLYSRGTKGLFISRFPRFPLLPLP